MSWDLPQLRITEGHVIALNDWTRLEGDVPEDGVVVENSGDSASNQTVVTLSGKRRSEDGRWYRMILHGPIYPEHPSVLDGYWKGATCQVELSPMA